MDSPAPNISERVTRLLRKRAVAWRRVERGYTPAQRWVATLDEGSSCFVKAGVGRMSHALRAEYAKVYSRLEAPFLPRLLGWDDDGETPLLVLEDLSAAVWPPPWTGERVSAVLEMLDALHSTQLAGLPALATVESDLSEGWRVVANDPAPFLSLGLCTPAWLEATFAALIAATETARLDGSDFVHFDVRSDNVCFADGRVVLVDWNFACRGNGEVDLAAWAPSLHAEGGPPPEAILPDAPKWAAVVSGFFAARAGLVRIPDAPRVRSAQLEQLNTALPWAVRALGLPPLDGPAATNMSP